MKDNALPDSVIQKCVPISPEKFTENMIAKYLFFRSAWNLGNCAKCHPGFILITNSLAQQKNNFPFIACY